MANLRLETLQKALEVAHADFLFATPNLQDGSEASALPVAAAAPDKPTPAPATSNRQIGRLARSYADAAQGLASLPPDDPEPNRTTSSLFSSQPDSKMPARAAKPDSKMPARASTSAKLGRERVTGCVLFFFLLLCVLFFFLNVVGHACSRSAGQC